MDYRKKLEDYYEYLGEARPTHKMITNHLLCFSDWLNEQVSQQANPADGAESEVCPECGRIHKPGGNTLCRR